MVLRATSSSRSRSAYDNEEGMRELRPDERLLAGFPSKSNGHTIHSWDSAPLSFKHLVTALFVILVIKVAIRYEMYRLPEVPDPSTLGVDYTAVDKMVLDTDQFVAIRARRNLMQITNFGIRMAGTLAADEMTVNWLLVELDNLRKQLNDHSPHRLSFQVDHVSGYFHLPFLSGYTSVYANVSNVLARVDPVSGDTTNALLLNCHYDSYFETVAASDDAVNCAIMLEILRALLSSQTSLSHSVIFLFNGAEENILQASNGFVAGSSKAAGNVDGAGHPWAKHVRAFINLEAAGAGGREILFQTGPGPATPILVRAYASAAEYPFASVLGQEIFQSGIIPSDTDFRIFRDHGKIPGIDFAFYTNGFVYHTRYDTPERIPDGTLQRAGVNILSIVRNLASSDLSKMPPVNDPNDRSGEKLVYFDVFSTYMFLYPFRTVGLFLNFLAIGGTVWRVMSLIARSRIRDGELYKKILILSILAHCFAILFSFGVLLVIAKFMSMTSACMSWYSRPWLLIPIYVLPATAAVFVVQSAFFTFFMLPKCSSANYAQNCERIYDISFDAALIIFSFALLLMSVFQIASSYVLCIWVGLPLLASVVMDRLVPLASRQGKSSNSHSSALLFRHTVLTFIPTVYFVYITDAIFEIFIPILGRSGAHVNPEFFIAAIVLFTIVILLVFHSSLVHLAGGQVGSIVQLIAVFSGFMIITVILTPFGHPYSLDATKVDGVHVQRSVAQLTMQRIISTPGGDEATTPIRSGLWFVPFDYNGIASLKGLSNKLDGYLDNARVACTAPDDPSKHPYCGLPYFFPVTEFVEGKTYWMDIEVSDETVKENYWPTISQMPTSPRLVTVGRWLVQYRVDCGETPQCSLYISPHSHAVLLRWDFSNEVIPIASFPHDKLVRPPAPTDEEPRPTWFVMLRFGSSSTATRIQQRSIIVTMELGGSGHAAASGKNLLDFAIVSHYFRGSSLNREFREIPNELRSFVGALPSWHFCIPVTSLYSSYAF